MNRKNLSMSSLGSGNPDPVTRIHPLTGGAINKGVSPEKPAAHEQGLGLLIPNAFCTASRLRPRIASQEGGRLHKLVEGAVYAAVGDGREGRATVERLPLRWIKTAATPKPTLSATPNTISK
ncbi:hypothetical protein SDC9_206950 [bioreactor metagenome]|uniref:Uncharacterized protein n=1 Tax=bioreactor metagenome TaxID=1076179 RepID=A0A645J944_9ZZZZ